VVPVIKNSSMASPTIWRAPAIMGDQPNVGTT
jgi:hypothetical protein